MLQHKYYKCDWIIVAAHVNSLIDMSSLAIEIDCLLSFNVVTNEEGLYIGEFVLRTTQESDLHKFIGKINDLEHEISLPNWYLTGVENFVRPIALKFEEPNIYLAWLTGIRSYGYINASHKSSTKTK